MGQTEDRYVHTDSETCWGTSLKMRGLARTIFLSHPKHKHRAICGRWDYRNTCYLTLQQCATCISSPEDPPISRLLASTLGSGQILLKPHADSTQPPGALNPHPYAVPGHQGHSCHHGLGTAVHPVTITCWAQLHLAITCAIPSHVTPAAQGHSPSHHCRLRALAQD